MNKASMGAWLVLIVLTFVLMVVLYSRVVYTLWFKQDNDNQLTYQQKVSGFTCTTSTHPLSSTTTATLVAIAIVKL